MVWIFDVSAMCCWGMTTMILVLVVKLLSWVKFPISINLFFAILYLSIFFKHQICSHSYLTQQYYFNFISGYRTPIEVNPVGSVQEVHGWFTVKNSEFLNLYSGSYTQNNEAIGICKHCWHSRLVYFIYWVTDLWGDSSWISSLISL